MIFAIDHDVPVSEKKEGAKGVGRILATVIIVLFVVASELLCCTGCASVKIVLLCCCYVPSGYLQEIYSVLDLLEVDVPVRKSLTNQFSSLGLRA